MKRIVLLLLSLMLCASTLVGCSKKTVHYKSYTMDLAAGCDVLVQLPNSATTFTTNQFWHYGALGFEPNQNAAPELSVVIGDLRLVGTQAGQICDSHISYLADRYKSGMYVFGVHPDSRQLVYFSVFGNGYLEDDKERSSYYKELQALPDLEKPQEDSLRIAQNLAKDYIDLSQYKTHYFSGSEVAFIDGEIDGERWTFDLHTYRFVKYINDVPTMDYLTVSVTSKGSIYEMKRGEIDVFNGIDFDISAVEENVDTYVKDIWNEHSFTIVDYEIESRSPRIVFTIDKQTAIYSSLRLQLLDPNGNEKTAAMIILTLFSTDPDQVIATTPYPFS